MPVCMYSAEEWGWLGMGRGGVWMGGMRFFSGKCKPRSAVGCEMPDDF